MSMSVPYPAQVEFHGDRQITRWRPVVQWVLAISVDGRRYVTEPP